MLAGYPIRQIAYVVSDVRQAAARHSAMYGSGPYLVGSLPTLDTVHRGKPQPLEMTMAFGQWGTMQVEFLQQTNDAPSVLREIPGNGERDILHHYCCIVDDVDASAAAFVQAGYAEASRISVGTGSIVFIDTLNDHGCFIELVAGSEMAAMYDMVANLAKGFDGTDPVREFTFAPTA